MHAPPQQFSSMAEKEAKEDFHVLIIGAGKLFVARKQKGIKSAPMNLTRLPQALLVWPLRRV